MAMTSTEKPTQATPARVVRAYRVAAGIMLVNLIMILAPALFAPDTRALYHYLFALAFAGLAVGLLLLQDWAAYVTMLLAVGIAILTPFLGIFLGDNMDWVVAQFTMQWGFTGALLLLLIGEPGIARVTLAVLVYLTFSFSLNALDVYFLSQGYQPL